jgi:WD40 repeat protein
MDQYDIEARVQALEAENDELRAMVDELNARLTTVEQRPVAPISGAGAGAGVGVGRRSPAPAGRPGSRSRSRGSTPSGSRNNTLDRKGRTSSRGASARPSSTLGSSGRTRSSSRGRPRAGSAGATRGGGGTKSGTTGRNPNAKGGYRSNKFAARGASARRVDRGDSNDPRSSSYRVGKRTVHVLAPSDYKNSNRDSDPPSTELQLDYVYGFNGKTVRNNLFYVPGPTGEPNLLYCIAGVGVLADPSKCAQSFFIGHDEDITSMALHPHEPLAATGQTDPKGRSTPYICIWNYQTMEEVCRLEGAHDRAVCAIAWSGDGRFIATIGEDDSHTMCVWDWEVNSKNPIASAVVAKDKVFGIAFNSFTETKDAYEFCTYGAKHLKSWTMMPDTRPARRGGRRGGAGSGSGGGGWALNGSILSSYEQTKVVQKAYFCALYLPNGDLVVATGTGDLYIFRNGGFALAVKAHDGPVGSLCLAATEGFASAGYDGQLVMWGYEYQSIVGCAIMPDGGPCKPSSIDFFDNGDADRIVVGTKENTIVEVALQSLKPIVRMEGHSGELWGLALHPTDPVVATCGHDKVLRCWDVYNRVEIAEKVVMFDGVVRACAFSPDGNTIAVGFRSGNLALVDYHTFEITYQKKHRKENIDALAFSPNGQLLALGSWDQYLELVDLETFNSISLSGHTSSITHLTFSVDSQYVITNSRDYEVLYWDVETGKRVEKTVTADVEWHEWHCVLGWPVQGIWRSGLDGTDVNAVAVTHGDGYRNRTLAIGDDYGTVCLYKYPCVSKKPVFEQYIGHSSHVTNAAFSLDNQWLFTTGGNDTALFQWAHVPVQRQQMM